MTRTGFFHDTPYGPRGMSPGIVLSCFAFSAGLLLGGVITGASEPSAADTAWPGWRGPYGTGEAAADARVPLDWSGENRLWKVEIEGLGHSSPIVWGDRVFLTTAIEGEEIEGAAAPGHTFEGQEFKHPASMGSNRHHTMKVLAVDASSGELVWSRTAYSGRVYDDRHSASSYASPSAVTEGERVYAYFGSEGVYAYDFEGELAWKTDIGDLKSVGLGVGSSPVLVGDLLIIQADEDSGDDSFIVALDRRTGREVWRQSRPVQASWSTPLVVERNGKTMVITSGNEHVIAYDPATGSEIWRADGLGNNAIHHPLLHENKVIFTSGYPEKMTFALDLDLRGDLSGHDKTLWRYQKGTAYVPSNLLHKGLLYLINDGGVMTCLDASSGEVVFEGGRFPTRGRFTASPILVDGKILMINESGDAAFIRAGREFEIEAVTSLDEPVRASPAVSGNRLYVRGRRHLYAFGHSE